MEKKRRIKGPFLWFVLFLSNYQMGLCRNLVGTLGGYLGGNCLPIGTVLEKGELWLLKADMRKDRNYPRTRFDDKKMATNCFPVCDSLLKHIGYNSLGFC